MVQNKSLVYKQIPQGFPVAGKDLAVETREFDIDQAPPAGGVTTKNFYASFDPYQRAKMRPTDKKSYTPPYNPGEPFYNSGVGKIIKSDNDKYKPGDLVTGMINTEEYSVVQKQIADTMMRKIDNPYNLDLQVFLGAMGMPGLTAYSSFYDIGKPKKGETIFISSAAGAVGQVVGQLAKHEGLKVIGSVGSAEKLDFITKELGFDAGFNYKDEKTADALARLAPDGIDIYYENVGGEQLEAALNAFNEHGRIVACGMISDYNKSDTEKYGIKNLFQFIAKRLTMRGFIVGDKDMGPKYMEERNKNVAKWLSEGTFKAKTHVTEGMDNAAEGFIGMLQGKNFGKAVLKIAEQEV
ncbi:NAD(P)-binding Rossmann-fold containing protein [Glarea lozoyensis ATCC 20868]|uniref:NAD(P)-binding Rossmann-fold containing protein n=2 Tax=Glarea lozoyensis TaxID=101852 RepID=S3CXI4_GLAL2|nr:NAD(P)-binding Rossmann-fold containing protein [Glarea lozoyensis ATCC 20868]EHL02190.1 putative Zinc-type alcohol dehydrogenase-like protein PB24D3.08c [Glarea lozoyensis 74030]EPE24546.1 NAD(P)-binding Rossmann-fold containing protein [Glarea lozoyensis ATCC 20868]